MTDRDDELLTPAEVAAEIKVTLQRLREWRYLRKGPPYFSLRPRVVRYRRSELERWIAEQEAATKVAS